MTLQVQQLLETPAVHCVPVISQTAARLKTIEHVVHAINKLESKYSYWLKTDAALTRQLVSFQANKGRARYRWYKYKEGFSADLVEHLLDRFVVTSGIVLDPFSGSGTTLFAASGRGFAAEGIELLPIGTQLIETRLLLEQVSTTEDREALQRMSKELPWKNFPTTRNLSELRITAGAYPPDTRNSIERCLAWLDTLPALQHQVVLIALLSILEAISYTRKDGQYLRWDYRSERRLGGRPFDKGVIASFDNALSAKLVEICRDMESAKSTNDLFATSDLPGKHDIKIHAGSCLEIMPSLQPSYFDAIITSPPYCNRYDYTRTYALELALLGVNESELSKLRQTMLSCTVENRSKDLLFINPLWSRCIAVTLEQPALRAILEYLDELRAAGELNNNGIARMVRGYFIEMACIIQECARVLKPGMPLIMVNDNVRYAGISIPVDLILSDIAQSLGFIVESILVLPNGKGNSSQQMGAHGREQLRKCIYMEKR